MIQQNLKNIIFFVEIENIVTFETFPPSALIRGIRCCVLNEIYFEFFLAKISEFLIGDLRMV